MRYPIWFPITNYVDINILWSSVSLLCFFLVFSNLPSFAPTSPPDVPMEWDVQADDLALSLSSYRILVIETFECSAPQSLSTHEHSVGKLSPENSKSSRVSSSSSYISSLPAWRLRSSAHVGASVCKHRTQSGMEVSAMLDRDRIYIRRVPSNPSVNRPFTEPSCV